MYIYQSKEILWFQAFSVLYLKKVKIHNFLHTVCSIMNEYVFSFCAKDARSNFQPDPLQLKLSSLGAIPALTGLGAIGSELPSSYGGRRAPHRGEVIYEQKVSPPRYSTARESHSELYSRRSTGFMPAEIPR